MKASIDPIPATREVPTKLLPACRCGKSQSSSKWPGGAEERWLVLRPGEADKEETEPKEAEHIEYECLSCSRRYRLRGAKLYEVLTDGSERPYMRQGQYGRWLSCR
ncbi:MAG TPA: hypothetical protein VJA21_12235 [Verrucomicrobiae bacterium]